LYLVTTGGYYKRAGVFCNTKDSEGKMIEYPSFAGLYFFSMTNSDRSKCGTSSLFMVMFSEASIPPSLPLGTRNGD